MIRIRYLVNDVDKAVEFYTSNFDFSVLGRMMMESRKAKYDWRTR
jgi:hypothetical protein